MPLTSEEKENAGKALVIAAVVSTIGVAAGGDDPAKSSCLALALGASALFALHKIGDQSQQQNDPLGHRAQSFFSSNTLDSSVKKIGSGAAAVSDWFFTPNR